ncbi:MAG TPA: tetratricopeptide repeat protein [Ideonella sp.]|uniref:YfgM family protein n=1 Tax=Ideonella sp. TaxID=1929293 RepID=UPI002E36F798|nr:tetratricopeptide repeat protein [Ideonella sp.]HEX5683362.1 tetratricopeptide repeat protein [Ideonella sp.]
MASNLDLQEQEQLDELKAFWKQYGNLITWGVTLVLGAFAAFNGWNYWQRDQGTKAAVMYEEFDKAIQAGDADQAGRVFSDLKERYARTAYAQQAGLQAAKLQADKGKDDAAQASLTWVAEQATDEEYKALAHLRLSALLLDKKAYDDALKHLDAIKSPEFAALVDDRRGDILLASGKKDDASKAYMAAYKAMNDQVEYRRIVEAKLASLGAAPEPAAAASGVAQ